MNTTSALMAPQLSPQVAKGAEQVEWKIGDVEYVVCGDECGKTA